MAERIQLSKNVFLTVQTTTKFKTGVFSCVFLRPMEEAAANALLTGVLMRGCRAYPGMRLLNKRSDELYGAGIGSLTMKKGDMQVVGVDCDFLDDAWAGEPVFEQVADLVRQLLLEPVLENGSFRADVVRSERCNLESAMDSVRDDHGLWCEQTLLEAVFRGQGYAMERFGTKEQLEKLSDDSLFDQYQRLLTSSRVEFCYLGSLHAEKVARVLRPLEAALSGKRVVNPTTTPAQPCPLRIVENTMQLEQGCLSACFTAPDFRKRQYAAMTVFQTIFGGGETNRLFESLRQQHGLCYAAGSWYDGIKGVLMASCGCDSRDIPEAETLLFAVLEQCQNGEITERELENAKMELTAHLDSIPDDARTWESFLLSSACCDRTKTLLKLRSDVHNVCLSDVIEASQAVHLCGIGRLEDEAYRKS